MVKNSHLGLNPRICERTVSKWQQNPVSFLMEKLLQVNLLYCFPRKLD